LASSRDLVHAWITEQIDAGIDFTNKKARIESREKFLLANPELKRSSVEAARSKVLTRIAKERDIPITKLKRPAEARREYNTAELNPKISREPVEIDPEHLRLGGGGQGQGQQGQGQQGQGQQGQGQQGQGQQGQDWQYREQQRYTAKTIGAFFNGLYMGLRAVIPEAEPLTDAERETLGELWVDHFNVVMAQRPNLSVVLALGGTVGLIGGKLIEARRRRAKAEQDRETINKTRDKARASARGAEGQEGQEQQERKVIEPPHTSRTTYDPEAHESGGPDAGMQKLKPPTRQDHEAQQAAAEAEGD